MAVRVTPRGLRAMTITDMERVVEVGIRAPDERFERVAGNVVAAFAKGNGTRRSSSRLDERQYPVRLLLGQL